MSKALYLKSSADRAFKRSEYDTPEEFRDLFASRGPALLHLAFQLTANSKAAQQCLTVALGDCLSNSSVSKEWIGTWARRAVVRRAIRLIVDTEGPPPAGTPVGQEALIRMRPRSFGMEPVPDLHIMVLRDFERLVFVICILEGYSIQDCALLLGRSRKDVYDAQSRAMDQVAPFEKWALRNEPCKASGIPDTP